MIRSRSALATLLLLAACGRQPAADSTPYRVGMRPVLEEQESGTTSLLQAVSIVDSSTVWISGHDATVLRTVDGGRTWRAVPVAGAPDSLQFRDVHAFDARSAYILSAGPGDMSRIYRTDDGGANWSLQWTNPEPAGFYDCFDFWSADRGVLYGDAVDGGLRVLTTEDGGRTWRRVPADALPAAQTGEGGFAASGLCVDTQPGGYAWIAAGNAPRTRVFRSIDWGRTWAAADVPIEAGAGAGGTAIWMVDSDNGYVFGGNLAVGNRRTVNVAYTMDGGRSWQPADVPRESEGSEDLFRGAISFDGPAYGGVVIDAGLQAVGPGGFAVCAVVPRDICQWTTIDARASWGIDSRGLGATWLAGPQGRVARVRWLESTSSTDE